MKIEKDIPIPSKNKNNVTDILRRMEVGDSVYLKGKTPVNTGGVRALAKASTGYSYIARSENGGTRIWRIA